LKEKFDSTPIFTYIEVDYNKLTLIVGGEKKYMFPTVLRIRIGFGFKGVPESRSRSGFNESGSASLVSNNNSGHLIVSFGMFSVP